jgi:uncharacterized protein YggU (UPF0235/DUF167 family)
VFGQTGGRGQISCPRNLALAATRTPGFQRFMTDLSHLARPGATIAIRVTPNARRPGVDLVEGQIRVAVTETPEAGKATEAARAALGQGLGRREDAAWCWSGAQRRATSCSGWMALSLWVVPFQPVAAFRQVQRGGKIADLAHRQGDAQHLVGPGIDLIDRVTQSSKALITMSSRSGRSSPSSTRVMTVASNSCSMVNMGQATAKPRLRQPGMTLA